MTESKGATLGRLLRTAEEWQATLIDAIESISEAFGLFDANDRLILCNRRYALTFTPHDSFKAIEGWHFSDLVRASVAKGEVIEAEFGDDIEAWVAERSRRHRMPGGNMRHIQLGDGTWLQVSERPTPSGGIVGVRTDITALKAAQHAAEAANESKTRFLRNMSHEIRTPMNGVLGMAQLLADSRLNATQKRYVEAIEQSGRHLLAIINDILDFSKIEAGQFDLESIDMDVADLIEESVAMLAQAAHEKGLEIAVELDPAGRFSVRGDPLRLQQIVINLVSNAVKFTDAGSIAVSVRRIGQDAGRTHFTIEVKDSGIGVAPDLHERIFDHFAQADGSTARKFGGTGLGLTICRQLARLMDGDITLESEPGRGALFRVSLNLPSGSAADQPRNSSARRKNADLPRMSGHVLLAEDNEVNKTVVLAWLDRLGFTTDCARNGREALALIETQTFDLVLMDCQMPEMDGFAATAEIRRREAETGGHVPIIALTANAIEGDRDTCLQAGMDDYLTKPFKGPHLVEVIARWLPASTSAAAAPQPVDPAALDLTEPGAASALATFAYAIGASRLAALCDDFAAGQRSAESRAAIEAEFERLRRHVGQMPVTEASRRR